MSLMAVTSADDILLRTSGQEAIALLRLAFGGLETTPEGEPPKQGEMG